MRTRVFLLITVGFLIVGLLGVVVLRRERTVQRAYTVLPRADGLREGAIVTYRGVAVGIVDELAFDTNGIQLELAFHDSVPLRIADTALLSTLGLLGERAIAIVPGPHTAPPLPANGVLPSRVRRPDLAPGDVIELLELRRRLYVSRGRLARRHNE